MAVGAENSQQSKDNMFVLGIMCREEYDESESLGDVAREMRIASVLCRMGFAVIGLGLLVYSLFGTVKTMTEKKALERQLGRMQDNINTAHMRLRHATSEVLRNWLLEDMTRLEIQKRSLQMRIRDI